MLAPMAVPQLTQNFTPGAFCMPQLVQKAGAAATGAGVAVAAAMGCPQLLQKACSMGTCVWQAGQVCIIGCEGVVACVTCGLNEEPQCIQKAAPAFTSPLQRGQTLGAAGATTASEAALIVAGAGVAVACTGVPHC